MTPSHGTLYASNCFPCLNLSPNTILVLQTASSQLQPQIAGSRQHYNPDQPAQEGRGGQILKENIWEHHWELRNHAIAVLQGKLWLSNGKIMAFPTDTEPVLVPELAVANIFKW